MYYENMMGMHAVWWVFWVGLVVSLLFWGGGSNSARRGKPRETPHEALRADAWRAVKSALTSMKNEKCF